MDVIEALVDSLKQRLDDSSEGLHVVWRQMPHIQISEYGGLRVIAERLNEALSGYPILATTKGGHAFLFQFSDDVGADARKLLSVRASQVKKVLENAAHGDGKFHLLIVSRDQCPIDTGSFVFLDDVPEFEALIQHLGKKDIEVHIENLADAPSLILAHDSVIVRSSDVMRVLARLDRTCLDLMDKQEAVTGSDVKTRQLLEFFSLGSGKYAAFRDGWRDFHMTNASAGEIRPQISRPRNLIDVLFGGMSKALRNPVKTGEKLAGCLGLVSVSEDWKMSLFAAMSPVFQPEFSDKPNSVKLAFDTALCVCLAGRFTTIIAHKDAYDVSLPVDSLQVLLEHLESTLNRNLTWLKQMNVTV